MLTIGQVASRTGLRASAIRYYESRGLLPKASRVGGKRVYERSVLKRLAVIELAKTAGFHLDEIRDTLTTLSEVAPSARWRSRAQAKRAELDAELRRLTVTKYVLTRMMSCSCTSLDECGRAFLEALSNYPVEAPPSLTDERKRSARTLSRSRRTR